MFRKGSPNIGFARPMLKAAVFSVMALSCLAATGSGSVLNYASGSYSNINRLAAGNTGSNLLVAQFAPDTSASYVKFATPQRIIICGPSGIALGSSITIEARTALGVRDNSFNGTATLVSSSVSGQFSGNGITWSASNNSVVIIVSGSASFYYRDSVECFPVINALHSFLVPDSQQETMLIDAVAPLGAVAVNNNNLFARSSLVTLNLTAIDTLAGVNTMVISNDASFTNANTISFYPAPLWNLNAGEGVMDVYVRFIDAVGNVSSSCRDSILVDLTAPNTGSVDIVTDTASVYAYSESVTLAISSADTLTAVDTMVISNYPDFSISETLPYANTAAWTLLPGDGRKDVYAKFIDSALNVSAAYSDTITQIQGTINGTVFESSPYDTNGYQFLVAVVIDVMKDTEVISSASTYSDGTFGFTDLASGTYSIVATYNANDVLYSVSSDIRTATIGLTYTLAIKYKLAQVSGFVAGVKAVKSSFRFGCKAFDAESAGIVELSQRGRMVLRVPVDAVGSYVIPNLLPGTFTARAFNGYIWSKPVTVRLKEGEIRRLNFVFESLPAGMVWNQPNPAKEGTTKFKFYCGYSSPKLEIRIYNIAGELVRTIDQNKISGSNPNYEAVWACDNDAGEMLASGVYMYQVIATDNATGERLNVIKKMMIIR